MVIFAMTGCVAQKDQSRSKYLRYVGDIEADANLDDPTFELCNDELFIKQYFNFSKGLQYEGEKLQIQEEFLSAYNPIDIAESGWVRIRFVVNCKGESGRFRMISSDKEYKPRDFDRRISDQLLEITKSLDGWKPLPNAENPEEYYQYLIFKIEKGNLIEIMP